MNIFNIFQKFAFAKRLITFIENVKKHYETVTIDDRAKELIQGIINNIKGLGELIPDLRTDAEWLISEFKKFLGCKKQEKK